MLKTLEEFVPQSWNVLRGYTRALFKKDLIAGVTVGIVSLPLAMAFALASGVAPERGLFTAVIAGFLISLLGGTKVQIGGPTAAFVVVVYTIVEKHGYEGLAVATIMAGVLLVTMGMFRLGGLIKLVPYPLVVGFTSGIAVVMFSSQIKDLLGLRMGHVPVQCIDKWVAYVHHVSTFDGLTAVLGLGTVGLIMALRRWFPSVPWGIAAIAIVTLLCYVLQLPVDTIASKFGPLPKTLPSPRWDFSFGRLLEMMPDAITIALLTGVESLLSALITDRVMGGKHKPNCELIGQGIANIGSALFGGIPATAALARTATNMRTGGQTPVAGMIHAVVIMVLLWSASSLVGLIPLAALAAVLVVVAWYMAEVGNFRKLMRTSKGDVAILLTSCSLTVCLDVTVAVEVGMLMAAFIFMKKMSDARHVVTVEAQERSVVYRVRGPLFFGVSERLKEAILHKAPLPAEIILHLEQASVIDATALQTINDLHCRCHSQGVRLILTGVPRDWYPLLSRYGLRELIGENRGGVQDLVREPHAAAPTVLQHG